MSLAFRILNSNALLLAMAVRDLRRQPRDHSFLHGAAIARRHTTLVVLKTHLSDCPKAVRKSVGQTIRRHLNIGGAR